MLSKRNSKINNKSALKYRRYGKLSSEGFSLSYSLTQAHTSLSQLLNMASWLVLLVKNMVRQTFYINSVFTQICEEFAYASRT